jgi:hypothetical protein
MILPGLNRKIAAVAARWREQEPPIKRMIESRHGLEMPNPVHASSNQAKGMPADLRHGLSVLRRQIRLPIVYAANQIGAHEERNRTRSRLWLGPAYIGGVIPSLP